MCSQWYSAFCIKLCLGRLYHREASSTSYGVAACHVAFGSTSTKIQSEHNASALERIATKPAKQMLRSDFAMDTPPAKF
jgi:hypothetical protein